MSNSMTVKWRGREIAISEADWRGCRRVENGIAALLLLVAGGMFVAGLQISGLQQGGVGLAILTGLAYFDSYVARFCAARKATRP